MKIIGTGSALPKKVVTNQMLEEFIDTSNEWIVNRTGIHQRNVISDEKLEDLAAEAANSALKDAGLEAKDIDFIVCSNVVNEYITPSLSCVLQGKIGATCATIDVNGACAGFVYGLQLATALLNTYSYKNILVVSAEETTRMVNWKDRSTCVLFGDGAGAAVLTKGNNLKAIRTTTTSRPESLKQQRELEPSPFVTKEPIVDSSLYMNGQDIFKMAVKTSIKDVRKVIDEAGVNPSDVACYVIHQANVRIIDSIRQYLDQPEEKFPKNISRNGNTSSASIPILLDELNKQGRFKEGDIIVMSAFGAGFTSGACVIEW